MDSSRKRTLSATIEVQATVASTCGSRSTGGPSGFARSRIANPRMESLGFHPSQPAGYVLDRDGLPEVSRQRLRDPVTIVVERRKDEIAQRDEQREERHHCRDDDGAGDAQQSDSEQWCQVVGHRSDRHNVGPLRAGF